MTKPTKWPVCPAKSRAAWLSAQSDQSLSCLHEEILGRECIAKTLIRLGGCPGWSEFLLGAQAILLVLSCCSSTSITACTQPYPQPLCWNLWQTASWSLLPGMACNASHIPEPPCDKTKKMAHAPSKASDQPGHPPSLITVFAVRMKKVWVLSYPLSAQRRLWSDWADAQIDRSLRWMHSHFVGFVMRWLTYTINLLSKMLSKIVYKNTHLPWACLHTGIFEICRLDTPCAVALWFRNPNWLGKNSLCCLKKKMQNTNLLQVMWMTSEDL